MFSLTVLKREYKQMQNEQQQTPPILLEVVAEDEHDADIVAIGEASRAIMNEVKQDGYSIEPQYTGQRGGLDLIFEVLPYLQTAWADVYAQRDTLGVIANLSTVFAAVSPIALAVFKAREKNATLSPVTEQPVKLTLMIDGAPIIVEATNLKDAESALELAKRFHSAHPTVKPTAQSQVKIQAKVPKKQQRRRR